MFKWSKKEKRKKYRTKAEAFRSFRLGLMLSGDEILPGDLVDINMDGAAIFFPSEKCPDFAPNERVKLQLLIHETKKTLFISAVLKDLRTDKDIKLCRFRFVNPGSFAQELGRDILEYFNRRQAVRVKPDVNTPIDVDLECENCFAKGWVIEISTTGMGLGVKPDVAKEMGIPERLTLAFQLPGYEKPFLLDGTITNRRISGKVFIYGIHFDQSQTEDFKRQGADIADYVFRRQKELLLQVKDG